MWPASLNSTESSFSINTGFLPVKVIVGFLKTPAVLIAVLLNFNFQILNMQQIILLMMIMQMVHLLLHTI
jgi:hypothetical protein